MRTPILRLLAALALLAAPLLASADHLHAHLLLTARLSGDQEVPAVTTTAQGVAAFTLNETRDTVFVQAAFSGLSGAVTGVHLHDGAVGVAGPVIINLLPMLRGNRLSGFLTGASIAPANLTKLLRGGFYINAHTATNTGGEIRGQVRLESEAGLIANMTGAQEVPAVTTTSASALGIFTLSQNQEKLKFRVTLAGLSSAITGAHFHTGAAGVAGPVVVNLLTYLTGNVIEGEIVPTAAFLTSLSQGQIYINVHTTNNPGGEIRGQLSFETRNLPFDSPPRRFTDGAGRHLARQGRGRGPPRAHTRLDDGIRELRRPERASHQHLAVCLAGRRGQWHSYRYRCAMATPPATNVVVGFRFINLTASTVSAFLRGDINLVINTAANPGGEVRGQLLRLAREGYTLALNGAQERPNPTASAGYGVGVVSIDRDQSNAHFMSVWGGLSGPATGGHFHTGPGIANWLGGVQSGALLRQRHRWHRRLRLLEGRQRGPALHAAPLAAVPPRQPVHEPAHHCLPGR